MNPPGPRACVIGWPVRHSRSPMVHRHWLDAMGLKGSYEHAEVMPNDFPGFVGSLAAHGFVGGNVTIPFKEEAFRLCHATTAVAAGLGAVNTVWLAGGQLLGDNTDVAGFLANLDEAAPGWSDRLRKVVVLGAGGAARAVLQGLAERGTERLVLVNRTRARAQRLRDAQPMLGTRIEDAEWTGLTDATAGADLLVNTTSLGMRGQPALDIDLARLPARACVADLVYVPLDTPLLCAARKRGLRAIDGLGMLLHQAVPGFERWFGVRPRVTPELRRLVAADIAGALSGSGA